MGKFSKFFSVLVVLMVVLAGCGKSSSGGDTAGGEGNSGKPITLSIGHTLTTDSPYHKFAETFKEEIEKSTDGQVTVEIFSSSQLGGELEMIDAVRSGSQDIVIAAQATIENTIPEWGIFSLPYLFDSIEQANKVLQSSVGTQYLDMLNDHGMVGLGWLSAIERDVFGNKKVDIDDMKGFKVRLMQSPGYISAYEALSASPTPMAYNELYVSLQQGVIDGADTSPDQFVQDKFVEVSDYFYLSKIHYLPPVVIIGQQKWDSLGSDLQAKVNEAVKKAIDVETEYYIESYEKGLEEAKNQGVEIVEVDTAAAKESTEDIRQELLKDIPNGEKLYEDIQNAK